METYGLLGERLPHSFSPEIHAKLGDYPYKLIELSPDALDEFFRKREFAAINVTVPYKKIAYAACDSLSDTARAIGSVNTVVKRPDGTLYGDNTDAYGFTYLLGQAGFDPAGKNCMVLGSGGSSVTVCHVLKTMGAAEVRVITHKENTREKIARYFADTHLIVNTTPVGMFPNTGVSPVDLSDFTALSGVVDLIYNPARTKLILDAEALGVPAASGLPMLVAQGVRAYEVFFGTTAPAGIIERILADLKVKTQNIVLVGMPGCGKTTVGGILAAKTGRELIDLDAKLVEREGRSIPEIFAEGGEPLFRSIESGVVDDYTKLSGKIIATGGGVVTVPENLPKLRQNGVVFFINRPITDLPTDGRPLSKSGKLSEMYERRLPLYRACADYEIDFESSEQVAGEILERLHKKEK